MKKPVVDYREFRFSRINEPRFSHIKYLLGWVFYFSMYFITENLIPLERCTPMHCALDDLIPFNEFFVIFYVGWYFLCFGSLLYFFLYDPECFKKLQTYIIITQVIAMTCYILFPSRQDLRPEVFPRENILTALIAFIYSFDTSSGVCPSLHVGYSLGILSVFWKRKESTPLLRGTLLFVVIMICMAVCFVKQHSAVDVFVALPMCMVAEWITFGKSYWKPRLRSLARG